MQNNNKFNFKNCLIITKYDLAFSFKSTLIWLLALVGFMALYMGMFPIVRDIMTDQLQGLPPELSGIFSSDGVLDMANYTKYFAMIYKLILTIICAYAMLNVANLIHDEEQRGSIEFLLSQNTSRSEILISKVGTTIVKMILLQTIVLAVAVVFGFVVGGDTFSFKAVVLSGLISYITTLTYIGIGALLGVLVPKKNKSTGIVLGIFFLLYIIGYISALGVDFLSFFRYFNPIDMLDPSAFINSNLGVGVAEYIYWPIFLSLAIALITFVTSWILYHKKDLQ